MRFVAGALAAVLLAGGLAACKDKRGPKTEDKAGSAAVGSARKPVLPRMRINAPLVGGPGVEPARKLSATVYYTPTDLSLGDQTLAEFREGAVQPKTLEYLVHQLQEKVRSDDPLGLVVEGSLQVARLVPVLSALKGAGFHNLAMVTREGKLIPLSLPNPEELGNGLRPVVRLQSGTLSLFSLSGQEGTPLAPLFSSPLDKGFEPLSAAIGELVRRRWPAGKRSPQDLIVTIEIERTQTIDTLMRAVATVRADASQALFPNVFLMVI
jgi:hypothetical protein